MKNKHNTLHKYIYEYSEAEYTKETVNGLFRSIIEPLLSVPQSEACVLINIKDTDNKDSLLKRLGFTDREIYGFNTVTEKFNLKNKLKEDIWGTTEFLIVSAKRYSAALVWDYGIAENNGHAKTLLLFNSKIVSDILKTVFDNSTIDEAKDILKKYNADRRENRMLNKAINNITGVLNENNLDIMLDTYEKQAISESDDSSEIARIIKEKAKFTAHEIKNNLSIINLYSTIAKKRIENVDTDEETAQSIETAFQYISNASENISKYISDLRCISKPVISEFNVKTFIENVISFCGAKAEKSNVNITFTSFYDGTVKTDKTKLECALTNIIYNGTEACEGKGNITIRDEYVNKKLKITVSNDGKVIPEEIREKIFSPEFTTKSNGNGLGLAICKKELNSVNGDINLVSSTNDATTFEITVSNL